MLANQSEIYKKKFPWRWWFQELMLAYKYAQKEKFKRALDALEPYIDSVLYESWLEFYEKGVWNNPYGK